MLPRNLFVLNVALLTTHQADAAYQKEWEVFGLPGGATFFLAFNVVAVLLLAMGLGAVAASHPRARQMVMACAGLGFVTCCIHDVFLLKDPVAFHGPVSLAILIAIFLVSAAQLATLKRVQSPAR